MATSKLTMLIELQDKLSGKLGQLENKWSKSIDKMKAKYQSFTDKIPGLGDAMDKIKMPWGMVAGGLAATFGLFAKSTAMANDWHTQLAEINVTAELGKKELQGLSDQLLEVGSRNVTPLEEIPKAFNRIISAGLDVNQSMEALEPTLRASKAGFTDLETVASAGIATMMSSGKDINRVYDILFETVKEGNAEFKDIARYIPKVVPLARAIGYELESTAGAYASLSTKLSAEQSSTALEGIYRTLSNADVAMGKLDAKTGKYVSGFRSIGINIFDSAGKIRPLIDIVGDLNKQMNGLTDEQKVQKLSKLGFDQSTALGFGTLMQDIEGLKKATEATTNSQGALNKAYMDSLTPMEQWGLIQNNIKGAMIKIGEKILPYVTAGLEKLAPIIQWFFKNIDSFIPVLFTFAGVLGLIAIKMILATLPISLTAIAIAALIALIVGAIVKYKEWGATVLWLMGPFGRLISAMILIYQHWESIKEAFKTDGIIGGLKRLGQVLLDLILQPLEQVLTLLAKLPASLGGNAAKDALEKIHGWRKDMNLVIPDKEKSEKKQDLLSKMIPKNLYGTTAGAFTDGDGNGKDKKGKSKLGKDVNKVTGDSKQSKNITINIDALNKGGINMNGNATAGLTLQDVENWFNEAMMRIMRNAELS